MELLMNVLGFLLHLLYYVIRPFYAFRHRQKPPSIPPITNPLLELSGTALARKIRNGEISSQTVVKAYIERIKEVNPFINAVVEDRFEAALNDAKACDLKIKSGEVNASSLEKEKPLYGVPYTVKESCSLQGLSLTGCTLERRGMKAAEDSFVVESLRNAGGIPLCVTNTPEMCSTFHSGNLLYGSTSNPYDGRVTSGGSSGGEGAIIGAGASVIGLGSDIAGSIRIPAHFCGIFGHKPTPGIIPIKGHFPLPIDSPSERYLVLGPMTRYAEDLHLTLKILSAKCGQDLRWDEPVDLKNLRVFYADNVNSCFGIRSTTEEIRWKIQDATSYFKKNGMSVQKMDPGWLNNLFEMLACLLFYTQNLPHLLLEFSDPPRKKSSFLELTKGLLGLSRHTKALSFTQFIADNHGFMPRSRLQYYQIQFNDLRKKMMNLLKEDGVLIFPTFPSPASLKDIISLKIDYSVYCLFVNILEFPSTHVPMGLNKDGLPIGFQVIAAPNQDRLCITVAQALEKQFGGWVPPTSDVQKLKVVK